jgi:hypothetical protein
VLVPLFTKWFESESDLFNKLIFIMCVKNRIRSLFVLEICQIFNFSDSVWQWDTVLILVDADLDALIVDASLRHNPFLKRPNGDPIALKFEHLLDYRSHLLH